MTFTVPKDDLWSQETILKVAYTYEQATEWRKMRQEL